ncbi:MAG TPA: hypothetical protein V6C76_18210 [Drouetiella sp.]
MADDDDQDDPKTPPSEPPAREGEISFAEELGIEELSDPIFGGRGRLFSAAGKHSPVAEFTEDFLIMHPPQLPFDEGDSGRAEDFITNIDEYGILLDELFRQKKIAGARFKGKDLFWLGEQKPGTLKHYAGWFDKQMIPHLLFVNGEPITTDVVFKLRNKTHDGEISIFPDLESDDVYEEQNDFAPPEAPTATRSHNHTESGRDKPMDSSASAESSKPTDSSASVESSKTMDSSASSESSKPMDSSASSESSKPMDSSASAESSKPTDSSASAESSKPVDSSALAESSKPTDSSAPADESGN